MRSAVFYGKHDLRVEDYPLPELGPKDVLIQVKACGICGTDVHIYEGDKGAAEVHPPTILGHEFAGVIAAVGSEATMFKVGDRKVQILSRVKLLNHNVKREVEYTIVSENEANLREGKLAIGTPIAKALLGKKVGEIVEVQVPAGILKLEILNISI